MTTQLQLNTERYPDTTIPSVLPLPNPPMTPEQCVGYIRQLHSVIAQNQARMAEVIRILSYHRSIAAVEDAEDSGVGGGDSSGGSADLPPATESKTTGWNLNIDTEQARVFFDFKDALGDPKWIPLAVDTDRVFMPGIGTPTYDTLYDFMNNTISSGTVVIPQITDNGDGTIDVTASKGYIRATDSDIAELLAFDVPAATDLNPTDEVLNFLYVDYNSGSPQYALTTSLSTVDHSTTFVVGLVFGESGHVHFVEAGQYLNDFIHRFYFHSFEHDGLEHSSGMVTSESGNRYLQVTAGVAYWALSRIATDALDTTVIGGDDFEYYYQDGSGGWTESSATSQIDNTYWDDGTGTLNTLTANRYGVHWIFLTPDSSLYALYGRGDYTLAQAQAATVPATMPAELSDFSILIAKIIVQEGATNLYSITLPWTSSIGSSVATDHGGMAGLGDDDHLQYLPLSGIRNMTGDLYLDGNDIYMGDGTGTGSPGLILCPASFGMRYWTGATWASYFSMNPASALALGQPGPGGSMVTKLYSGSDVVEFDAGIQCPAGSPTDYLTIDNATGDLDQYGDALIHTEATVEADSGVYTSLIEGNFTKAMSNNTSQNFFKWIGTTAGDTIGYTIHGTIKVEHTVLATTYYWSRSFMLSGNLLYNGTDAYGNSTGVVWKNAAQCRNAAGGTTSPTMNETVVQGSAGSGAAGPYFLVNLAAGFVSARCQYTVISDDADHNGYTVFV